MIDTHLPLISKPCACKILYLIYDGSQSEYLSHPEQSSEWIRKTIFVNVVLMGIKDVKLPAGTGVNGTSPNHVISQGPEYIDAPAADGKIRTLYEMPVISTDRHGVRP